MKNDTAHSLIGVAVIVGAMILITFAAFLAVFAFGNDSATPPHSILPYGYVTNVTVFRNTELGGVFLSENVVADQDGISKTSPNMMIYLNNTPWDEALNLGFGSTFGSTHPNRLWQENKVIIFIPCQYPTDIRVYNNQIAPGLTSLAFEGTV